MFVSGGGTDMQSIINAVKRNRIKGEIVAVIASKPGIYALKRAEKHKIPSYVFERKNYVSPEKCMKRYHVCWKKKYGSDRTCGVSRDIDGKYSR